MQTLPDDVAAEKGKPPGLIDDVGSGNLVRYKDNYYIATCAHCLETKFEDIKVYVGPTHPLIPLADLCSDPASDIVGRKTPADQTDLAYVRISEPAKILECGKVFLDFDPSLTKRILKPHNHVFFVQGYPAALFKEIETNITPGGVILPEDTKLTIQHLPLLDLPIFEIFEADQTHFKGRLQGRIASQMDRPLNTRGMSGGPLYRVMDKCAINGDPKGFFWLGILSHQSSISMPRFLVFQHPARWGELVDGELESTPLQLDSP